MGLQTEQDHRRGTGRQIAPLILPPGGSMQVGRRILRTALITGSALGLTAGGSVLALTAGSAAAGRASTCAAAWSASTVYTGGQQASENGTNYTANWWTQGNDPATNNGGSRLGPALDLQRRLYRRFGWVGRLRRVGRLGRLRWVGRLGLGEWPAVQPVQGRHHQHELEHQPDAVGGGRVRHPRGRLGQPGLELHPEPARHHPRVRHRSLRQRELGWCRGGQLGVREHSAAQQRRAELRGLDRW